MVWPNLLEFGKNKVNTSYQILCQENWMRIQIHNKPGTAHLECALCGDSNAYFDSRAIVISISLKCYWKTLWARSHTLKHEEKTLLAKGNFLLE